MKALRIQNSGFSLLEVMVALVVGALMILTTSQVMLASGAALEQGTHETVLQARALMLVDEIANEIKDASSTDVTKYGVSGGVVWFYKCLGYWPAGQSPPGEEPLASAAVRWSSRKIEYRLESEGGKQRLIRYEVNPLDNDDRVGRVLAEDVAPDGFSLINNGASRVRIIVRLQRIYQDSRSGRRIVQATAGTDVKREN